MVIDGLRWPRLGAGPPACVAASAERGLLPRRACDVDTTRFARVFPVFPDITAHDVHVVRAQ